MLFIGVSTEDDKKIQEVFIDKLGAKYPIIQVDKAVVGTYGIKFYPSIYCIDPDGNVYSQPDDRMPGEGEIEKLLKNATLAPKLPADSKFDPLRKMWDKKDHGKLRDYLAKMLAQDNLDDELRTVFQAQQETLNGRAARQLAKVEKLAKGPDYFAATVKLEKIEDDWDGFEAAAKAGEELARFKKDSDIKKQVKAGKALDKLLSQYDLSKPSHAKKRHDALLRFAKKYAGTHAADTARRMVVDG